MANLKLVYKNGRPVLVDAKEVLRSNRDKNYNDKRSRDKKGYIKFYNSKLWKVTRDKVMLRDLYRCQRCGREAYLVDHIIPSELDWEHRLDTDWLQALCQNCHRLKTKREREKKEMSRGLMNIKVISGFPGSGKSYYVDEHKTDNDLVFDYNKIMSSLTGLEEHKVNPNAHEYVMLVEELMLRKLTSEHSFDNIWIVTTEPDERLVTLLSNLPRVSYKYLDVEASICEERLRDKRKHLFDKNKFQKTVKIVETLKQQSFFSVYDVVKF